MHFFERPVDSRTVMRGYKKVSFFRKLFEVLHTRVLAIVEIVSTLLGFGDGG